MDACQRHCTDVASCLATNCRAMLPCTKVWRLLQRGADCPRPPVRAAECCGRSAGRSRPPETLIEDPRAPQLLAPTSRLTPTVSPLPPFHSHSARIRTIKRCYSACWGARIRTWEWRNQNPLPYHLATPQRRLACRRGARTTVQATPIRRAVRTRGISRLGPFSVAACVGGRRGRHRSRR